jgi:hypothetical protein
MRIQCGSGSKTPGTDMDTGTFLFYGYFILTVTLTVNTPNVWVFLNFIFDLTPERKWIRI